MAEDAINKPMKRAERIGKYEIVGHIATGGMGVIYKARDTDLDRVVALKVLPPDLAAQPLTLIRFQREAKAAARLRHENIVAIFDVGECNGTYYIALEFIDGTDLQDYITRKDRLDPEEARAIMIQAARALVHAHEKGIVHRDIKPSNFLLIQKKDRIVVKLTDFGLAIRQESDEEFRITKDKTTVGTVDYMSPEQARDSRAADIRSDIYSLGCTFYHMLAGAGPFSKGTLPERIIQHMKSPPPDVRKVNKDVPETYIAILNRMLAKKPDERYQLPADLLDDLEHPDRVVVPAQRERPSRRKAAESTEEVALKEKDTDVIERRPSRPARPKRPAEAGKDTDDDDDAPTRRDVSNDDSDATPAASTKRKGTQSSQGWMIVIGGSVGVLILVLLGTLIFGGRSAPVNPKGPDKTLPPPIVFVPPSEHKPPPTIDTSAAKMTVLLPSWPAMDRVDRDTLRKDYYGAFTAFPAAPENSTVLRVSRLATNGVNQHRTLASAFAAAKPGAFTVVEIHDDGPIFASSLAPEAKCSILLRGADGYRPLLVWNIAKRPADAKGEATFCKLAGGSLILDNLDFVVRTADDAVATIFDVPGADFHARDCTFSLAGKSKDGIALVRRRAAKDALPDPRTAHTWIKRCYVRGSDMTLLRLQESSDAVLIEESLIVGYQHPLIDVRGRDNDSLELACVRSTLVTGHVLLRWRSAEGKGVNPTITGKMLDSILSRDDTVAPPGDMILLADDAEPRKMTWRAANTVYAGWRQLLGSGPVNIGGTDLPKWHDQWFYRDGDRAIPDTWPGSPPSALEDQPAAAFLPQAPVAYAAAGGEGSIGAVIGWLPPVPDAWLERGYEPRVVPGIPAASSQPPALEKMEDGLYHGEPDAIDLNKVDLGLLLSDRLLKMQAAPRVVMHLKGRGVCQTSPLRIKGVQHLILYCREPFTLEANPLTSVNRVPLIEMAGGHLELIRANILLKPGTLVPTIIDMHGGNLTLTGCRLQGPHGKTPDNFYSLITARNPGPAPVTLLLRDNVLAAGKLLLHLTDHVQLKAGNNVFLSLGDGVQFDANSPSAPMLHVLDHNTWGVRHSVFALKTGPEFQPAGSVLLHASSNAFLRPFTEEADKGTLLRGAETCAGKGRWSWQGRFNVYDPRLHGYFSGPEKTAAAKQTTLDWQLAWGPPGEQDSLLLPAPAAAKMIILEGKTQTELVQLLERLALPPELRGNPNQSRPGADLVYLGLKKKG